MRMESSVLGGGLLFAIAAGLWLVYLVPNWLRRREYLATERNAVRLQQTIRVLAETAETPEAVRVENAARARAIAKELNARPVAVGARVTTPLPASMDPHARASARLRRTRLVVTGIVTVALVIVVTQSVIGVTAGIAAVSVPIAVGAALVVVTGVAMLGRLAKVGRERTAAVASGVARVTRSVVVPDIAIEVAQPAVSREWTPVPLPRPTYLDRRATVQPTPAQVARAAALAEAELSEAAEVAARAIRTAQEQVPAATRPSTPAAPAARVAASTFASMGVVDATAVPAMPDIDGALRRRRAG